MVKVKKKTISNIKFIILKTSFKNSSRRNYIWSPKWYNIHKTANYGWWDMGLWIFHKRKLTIFLMAFWRRTATEKTKMLTVSFDFQGIGHYTCKYLPPNQTVNKQHYLLLQDDNEASHRVRFVLNYFIKHEVNIIDTSTVSMRLFWCSR